jgi:hypothetical protein
VRLLHIAVPACALAVLASTAAAQHADPLTPGVRLRVTRVAQPSAQPASRPGTQVPAGALVNIGTLQALDDSVLVLATSGSSLAVPLADISRLERSLGRQPSTAGAIGGFVLGFVAGGLVGCHFNRDSYDVFCAGQNDTKVVGGAVLGGVVGAVLGSRVIRRERWTHVSRWQD